MMAFRALGSPGGHLMRSITSSFDDFELCV